MGFLLSKLLPIFLYPLGLALLLQIIALFLPRRNVAIWISGAGIGLLWLASMPLVSRQLVWKLEEQAIAMTPAELPPADAVLVLGGGLLPALPPRRGVEVNSAGDRLLTGVVLMREGRAPWLLVSGGQVSFAAGDPAPSEARSAARLAVDLGVPADRILLSEKARNTAEEASALESIARRRGWRSVLLVTSAMHLPRAVSTFRRRTTLTIVPVGCDYELPKRGLVGHHTPASLLMGVLPSSEALLTTSTVVRERLGGLIYRWRGWS